MDVSSSRDRWTLNSRLKICLTTVSALGYDGSRADLKKASGGALLTHEFDGSPLFLAAF